MALLVTCVAIAQPVMAEEVAAPVSDAPAVDQDLLNAAKDGDVAMPRARKVVKPNRALMKMGVANAKVGMAFMAENQQKPGVVILKSGLQYKILKAGAGRKPGDGDVVKCHYNGKLLDGTVFEQSEPGKPASVKVDALVAGLNEAIKLMPVGSRWEVYVPPELGFGVAGMAPKVGPDAVLVYEIELLAVGNVSDKR